MSSSWVQASGDGNLGLRGGVKDFTTTPHQQHLEPQGGEVLLLSVDVCQFLLANNPSQWFSQVVSPDPLVPLTPRPRVDPGSGLTVIDPTGLVTWGIDSQNRPYFNEGGVLGGDVAHIFPLAPGPFGNWPLIRINGGGGSTEAKPRLTRGLGLPIPRPRTRFKRSGADCTPRTPVLIPAKTRQPMFKLHPLQLDGWEQRDILLPTNRLGQGQMELDPGEELCRPEVPSPQAGLLRIDDERLLLENARPDSTVVVRYWHRKRGGGT